MVALRRKARGGKSEHRFPEQSGIQRSSLTATGYTRMARSPGIRENGAIRQTQGILTSVRSAGPLRRVSREGREACTGRNRNIPPQAQAEASARSVVRLKSWGKGPRGSRVIGSGVNADPVQVQVWSHARGRQQCRSQIDGRHPARETKFGLQVALERKWKPARNTGRFSFIAAAWRRGRTCE